MKLHQDKHYDHPKELWLPFESILIRLRMNLKAVVWISIPLIVVALILSTTVFASIINRNQIQAPFGWKAFGNPIQSELWPKTWVDPLTDQLTNHGYKILPSTDTMVFVAPRRYGQGDPVATASLVEQLQGIKKTRSSAWLWAVITFFGLGGLLLFFTLPKIIALLKPEGKRLKEDQHVRGARVLPITRFEVVQDDAPVFDEQIAEIGHGDDKGKGDLPIIITKVEDGITDVIKDIVCKMPIGLELVHMLFLGATGAGKTQSLLPMLIASIDRGTKNIIYDVKKDFTEKLFDPEKFELFQPFDARSLAWCPFADLEDIWDCREFAQVLIPEESSGGSSSSANYFAKGTQDILGSILYALMVKGMTSNKDLLDTLHLSSDLIISLLSDVPESAPAINHIGGDSDQTQGIIGGLRAACMPLDLLARWKDTNKENSFSFKAYIRDDSIRKNLILGSDPEYQAIISPLLSTCYNIMFKTSLARKESYALESRNLFWFDELGNLSKMDSLPNLLTLARSKNTGIFAAIQDFGMLRHKYGPNYLETLLNNFVTLIVGRLNETNVLQWLEKRFGEEEYMSYKQGHSFGPSDFSDRLTSDRDTKKRSVVMASEVSTLKNLEQFVLCESLITNVQREYVPHPNVAKAFVPYKENDITDSIDIDFGA